MTIIDNFASNAFGLRDPASHAFPITPSDTEDLSNVTRKIYVGGSGDVCLITLGGETVTFKALTAGITLDVRATRVKATGTSASMYLLGLY